MLRNKYLFRRDMRYTLWAPQHLENKLKKSFLKNYHLSYKERVTHL